MAAVTRVSVDDESAGLVDTAAIPVVTADTATPKPSPAPRSPRRPGVVLAAAIALNICLVAVWFLVYTYGLSALGEHRAQRELYATLRGQLAGAVAPIGGVIEPGSPVALIDAPGADLSQTVVVEGTSSGDLMSGPGHLRNSVMPGQAGVAVLMGRGAAAGAPFARIGELSKGDPITVTTGQGVFTYQVEDVRRAGDPLPPPLAAGTGRLVLVSSEGASWRTGWSPSGAVYVDAALKGKPQPMPAGKPIAVPNYELPMQGDPTAWVPLVVWLQLGLLLVLGVWWVRRRLGRWEVWLIAVPLAAAVLWGASENAMQLLPNLL
jgi:sortase A